MRYNISYLANNDNDMKICKFHDRQDKYQNFFSTEYGDMRYYEYYITIKTCL